MADERYYKAILNSISEGVMTVDKDWKIVSWNRAAEMITGFHREEVLGKECMTVFRTPLCRERCPVDRALSCAHPNQNVEVAVRNKRNEVVHLMVNAAPLFDSDGRIMGGLESFRDVSQNRWLQEELKLHYGYTNVVGRSEAMKAVYEVLASLMMTDTTVLIQGESGTGKELVARALHFNGPRKDKSFVAVNCSALAESVLESELFGHAKGSFTGATKDHVGRFELANGGTLFLDEIGEISPALQVKLLRVLEEREIQRVGDNTSIKVDIRLITATNKELHDKVREGSFRDDLFYRLCVVPLRMPPLRERIEDIPLLVAHFIEKFNNQMGRNIQGIGEDVLEALETYSWPGNVREMANAIEHAFVHCKGMLIRASDLPHRVRTAAPAPIRKGPPKPQVQLDLVERELIVKELEKADWKKSVAARRLGISRTTLWRRMQKFGISE